MKNTFDFTIRIHQSKILSCLDSISEIIISNITLIRKDTKYQVPFIVEGNKKKFGYDINFKPKFLKGGGSHSYPRITFKGHYIDIHVKNFPRYPAYYQPSHIYKNWCNGFNPDLDYGFPNKYIQERIEILNLKQNELGRS